MGEGGVLQTKSLTSRRTGQNPSGWRQDRSRTGPRRHGLVDSGPVLARWEGWDRSYIAGCVRRAEAGTGPGTGPNSARLCAAGGILAGGIYKANLAYDGTAARPPATEMRIPYKGIGVKVEKYYVRVSNERRLQPNKGKIVLRSRQAKLRRRSKLDIDGPTSPYIKTVFDGGATKATRHQAAEIYRNISAVQVNSGEFGCNSCLDPGESVKGPHRVWPYTETPVLRTNATYEEHLEEFKGVKGASVLYSHVPFDMGQGFPCDWMHGVLLGVLKYLLDLLLSLKNAKKPFYIGDKILWISEQLCNIKVPDNISHAPRSLTDRHHFKASELRALLLHYLLPVLRDVLPTEYYAHLVLLVSGVSTLVSDNITADQLQNAGVRLDAFCKAFEGLYGKSAQTMNIHLLRHLAHNTALYGPLWTYSCFGFETMNGHIKRMVHGTRFVVEQITCPMLTADNLQRLVSALDPERESTRAVCLARRLSMTGRRCNMTELTPGVYRIGPLKDFHPDKLDMGDEIQRAIRERVGEAKCEVFYRANLAGQNVYSRGYARETVNNNRTVEFVEQKSVQYAEVMLFCNVNSENLAVLRCFHPIEAPLINIDEVSNQDVKGALALELESFVIEVTESYTCIVTPMSAIRRKCVLMQVNSEQGSKTYIGRFPNIVEHD
ncbi:hypothetical protein Bbelb_308330 [Branchiostoma belcheri]|nr:hypothetical protein Bbelb_308330 [Branchiostoma belcheri]